MRAQLITVGRGLFSVRGAQLVVIAWLAIAITTGCNGGRSQPDDNTTTTANTSADDQQANAGGEQPAATSGSDSKPGAADTAADGSSGSADSETGSKGKSPKNDNGDGKQVVDATTPPAPQGNPADAPVRVISFDDLNIGMPIDKQFRPRMLEYEGGRVKELFGRRVNVAGYMNPTDTLDGVTEFILLRNLECKFGPGGQADHLVHVLMEEGLTTKFTDKIVYVEGVISLNPFPLDEPITWSIYDIKATKVSTTAPPRNR